MQLGYAKKNYLVLNSIVPGTVHATRLPVFYDPSQVEAYWCFSTYLDKVQKDFSEDGLLDKLGKYILNYKQKNENA